MEFDTSDVVDMEETIGGGKEGGDPFQGGVLSYNYGNLPFADLEYILTRPCRLVRYCLASNLT